MAYTTTARVHDLLSRHAYSADCVAAALGVTPNAAWIAMRNLRKQGAIELVRTEGRHRIYRAVAPLPETTGRYRPQALYGSGGCLLAEVWK